MSIPDYLALVFWKVALHLQGEACRTAVPCWHVSYSEKERDRERQEGKSANWQSEFCFTKWEKKSMTAIPPWQLPPCFYLCLS